MTANVKLTALEDAFLARLPEASGDWRAELKAHLEEKGLPHRRVEEWKWTDLKAALSRLDAGPGELVLDASREADATTQFGEKGPRAVMPRLASALGGDIAIYRLTSDRPSLMLDFTAKSGAVHKTVVIEVEAGTKADLHEIYRVDGAGFANLSLLIRLGEGASLARTIEQVKAEEGVLVVTSGVELAPEARFTQVTLGFGARLARLETHVTHPGEGAQVSLNGAYVLGESLHLDQTTLVDHTGPHGVTRELFKGAASGRARGVFQGKIAVQRPAQKTDAEMQHRGMLLTEGAEIDAKPELEIYADDVVCAHGNALGTIDEDALFYMRQRGLSEAQARAVLTESFLAEPLGQIAGEARAEDFAEKLRARLRELA